MVSGGVPTNDVQAFMRFWGCAVRGEEPDKDFMLELRMTRGPLD